MASLDMFAKDMTKALPSGYSCGVDADLIKEDSTLPPLKKVPPQASKYLPMFHEWRKKALAKLQESLPDISSNEDWTKACQSVIDARKAYDEAVKRRDEIKKHKPVDEDAVNKAKEAIEAAEEEEKNARQQAEDLAVEILQQPEFETLLSDDYDDSDLVFYTVLMDANPKELALWCDQNEEQGKEVVAFLKDVDMIRKFLNAGGARRGEYGRAVQIYNQIHPDPNSDVLQRLALAVALELADPLSYFGYPKKHVDPLKRYLHYEQAYLLGELDPNFSTFNVWEMRQIINSDASDEELGWGRQSLLNYRPDIAYSNDPQWQYCNIVKSDVTYAAPDWYKQPRSYDQILSGGGKCGPRAWYGRFICKAFGIPTWGVKQPGHAALTRWTRNGWCVCLGAAFKYSYFGYEGGEYWELMTKAMRACETEEEYTKKVRRLEWVGAFHEENSKMVKREFLPDTKAPWWALSLLQSRHLSHGASDSYPPLIYPQVDVTENVISTMMAASMDDRKEGIMVDGDGVVTIPAAACSKPEKTNKQVSFQKSFLGGQQLFITQNGIMEYTVAPPIIPDTPTKYNLTCRVCSAHRKEQPINLTVNGGDPIAIPLTYNMAMWAETEPVEIELGGESNTITIQRNKHPFGFAIKDIKLTPA